MRRMEGQLLDRGLCECGCGELAPIATQSLTARGDIIGQPMRCVKGHRPGPSLEERFWAKVNKNGSVPEHCPELGPCWLWTGALSPKYGIMWYGGRNVQATHVAIYLETGKWPQAQGCHRCDLPACVRFSHLFDGTQKDNIQDALKKGRRNKRRKI